MESNKPIIIQGAMSVEIEYLIQQLENREELDINGYQFYKGQIENYPVIISKTEIGVINSSVATTLAILKFAPSIIINQGIAGAHSRKIHKKDIVVGINCININCMETEQRGEGQGSNPFAWTIVNRHEKELVCDNKFLELVKENEKKYKEGKIYYGVIGSGDAFNREIDRIDLFHQNYHTLCEDMETISAYTVADKLNIPCIGIRVISNNEITKEEYDRDISVPLQKYIIELCKKYIEKRKIS
jgi:adenosylhomocysteine nucleosidase